MENNNEIIKRKYEFNTQFTAVVGVVFGVLAAFNNIGENKLADIAYIVGLVCCGLCLLLCVIGLYQPVHNEQVKRDNNIIKACGDLINVFTVENEQTEGELKETEQIEEIKPSKTFKWLHICSHVLFVVAIICMVITDILSQLNQSFSANIQSGTQVSLFFILA